MGVYSKGTRSKGVTRQFNSAAQVGNQQKSKKARVDAYPVSYTHLTLPTILRV